MNTTEQTKRKRLKKLTGKTTRKLATDKRTGGQHYVSTGPIIDSVDSDANALVEGAKKAKKAKTAAFIKLCVKGITAPAQAGITVDQPQSAPKVKTPIPSFREPAGQAAQPGTPKHSATKYEKALGKLKEDVEALRRQNPDRRAIVFGEAQTDAQPVARDRIQFAPEA